MRKPYAAPLTALVMGAAGAALRWTELNTAFEADTGLHIAGSFATVALAVLSVLAVMAAVLFGGIAKRSGTAAADYPHAFPLEKPAGFLLSAFFGAVFAGAALLALLQGDRAVEGVSFYVFVILGAAAGASMVTASAARFTRKTGSALSLAVVIPALFFAYLLAAKYKENAYSPVILSYCYVCLALAASAFCHYYAAGFNFGRGKPGATVFTHFAAIYFLSVTMADSADVTLRVILLGNLCFTAISLWSFQKGDGCEIQ